MNNAYLWVYYGTCNRIWWSVCFQKTFELFISGNHMKTWRNKWQYDKWPYEWWHYRHGLRSTVRFQYIYIMKDEEERLWEQEHWERKSNGACTGVIKNWVYPPGNKGSGKGSQGFIVSYLLVINSGWRLVFSCATTSEPRGFL